jgi:hypothetical protein
MMRPTKYNIQDAVVVDKFTVVDLDSAAVSEENAK